MYLGSIEEGGEGEAAAVVTEVVTGVVIVAEGDTVPTGGIVDVAEDVVTKPWVSQEGCRIPTLCSALHFFLLLMNASIFSLSFFSFYTLLCKCTFGKPNAIFSVCHFRQLPRCA